MSDHLDDYMYHRQRVEALRLRSCGNPSRYEEEEIAYHVGHAWRALIEEHKAQGKPYNAIELLEYAGGNKCWTVSKT